MQKLNPYKAYPSITIVPTFLMSRREISSTAKLLYSQLSYYHGKTGPCFPGVQRLADDLGVQKRHIYRCLSELKAFALISVSSRKTSSQTSIYEFNVHPWMYARPGLFNPDAILGTSPGDVTGAGDTYAPGDGSDTSPGDVEQSNVRPIAAKRRRSASIPPGVGYDPGDVEDTSQVTSPGRVAAEPGAALYTTQLPDSAAQTSAAKQKMAPIASAAFRSSVRKDTCQVSDTSRPGVLDVADQVSYAANPSIQGREKD